MATAFDTEMMFCQRWTKTPGVVEVVSSRAAVHMEDFLQKILKVPISVLNHIISYN